VQSKISLRDLWKGTKRERERERERRGSEMVGDEMMMRKEARWAGLGGVLAAQIVDVSGRTDFDEEIRLKSGMMNRRY
jgi:hypothetical protein